MAQFKFQCKAMQAIPHRPLKKLVIDTDPGCDDTVALLAALECGEFEVLGLTTVYGNSDIDQTTLNASLLLAAIDHNAKLQKTSLPHLQTKNIRVYKGAGGPWSGKRLPSPVQVHGKNGLGDVDLTKMIDEPAKEHIKETMSAAEFIVDVCNRFPGEVHFLFDGPSTNLADAMKLDPSIPSKWANVAMMGGAFYVPGNVTPYAEANFRGDPDATAYVFRHAAAILVVGLDITVKSPFTEDDLRQISEANANGNMLAQIYKVYQHFYTTERPEIGGAPAHDAVALMALIAPELFTWKTARIAVTVSGKRIGQTVIVRKCSTRRPKNLVAISGEYRTLVTRIKDFIVSPRTTSDVLSVDKLDSAVRLFS